MKISVSLIVSILTALSVSAAPTLIDGAGLSKRAPHLSGLILQPRPASTYPDITYNTTIFNESDSLNFEYLKPNAMVDGTKYISVELVQSDTDKSLSFANYLSSAEPKINATFVIPSLQDHFGDPVDGVWELLLRVQLPPDEGEITVIPAPVRVLQASRTADSVPSATNA